MMNWKGCDRERLRPTLRKYPGICLEGLRKTTKKLGKDTRSPGLHLNTGFPEYEAGALTNQPQLSICNRSMDRIV
jgi:hypothetical protein